MSGIHILWWTTFKLNLVVIAVIAGGMWLGTHKWVWWFHCIFDFCKRTSRHLLLRRLIGRDHGVLLLRWYWWLWEDSDFAKSSNAIAPTCENYSGRFLLTTGTVVWQWRWRNASLHPTVHLSWYPQWRTFYLSFGLNQEQCTGFTDT